MAREERKAVRVCKYYVKLVEPIGIRIKIKACTRMQCNCEKNISYFWRDVNCVRCRRLKRSY